MLISYNWLKDYIDIKTLPEKLGDLLTMAGLTVASIHKKGGDSIIEIEVTSNRPDWLSIIGVAREIAAITGAKLKMPAVSKITAKDKTPGVKVTVEDKGLCPRYTARIIRNVAVKESPDWLKAHIEAMGLRPVNNIVDITNFCLFETGEPMHAFDLDKISGGEVIIRKAKKSEKIVMLDGVERAVDDTCPVIADKDRPIAVAGVMGGVNTEVTFSTKNILLEAASFDPVSIRRTARKLGVSTESSYRFERKVDIENIIYSSDRASGLIHDIAGGDIGSIRDIGKITKKRKSIDLRFSRLNKMLGVDIPASDVRKILISLGLKVVSSGKDKIKLEPPQFRYDLEKEIDLVEEVSRIYGYDRIPETIPPIVDQPARRPLEVTVKKRISNTLTSLGCDEIITYSLLSRKYLAMLDSADTNTIEINNPLSSEQETMRTTLLPGLLNSILWNINRKVKDLRLFEIGNIYTKEPGGRFSERTAISIGITGQVSPGWLGPNRPSSFFDLKGAVEALFDELGIHSFSFEDTTDARFYAGRAASIKINGQEIGMLGEVAGSISRNFGIKDKVYSAEIYVDSILGHVAPEKRFKELPKYPAISRDISILAAKDISNRDIISSIKEAAGSLLKEARLIDRYAGGQVPKGKISLTYRLEYQDPNKTLEDKEVSIVHSAILQAIENKFGAKLR